MQPRPRSDLETWRCTARALLEQETPPARARWHPDDAPRLDLRDALAAENFCDPPKHAQHSLPRKVSKIFLELARRVLCHTDPQRHGLLYEALWRLTHGEAHLFEMAHDPLVRRLELYDRAVRRDIHKTHAFVRFQPIRDEDGEQRFVAWFEPRFSIVKLVGRFFVERFTTLRWTLLTPTGCAAWDGRRLSYSEGIDKPAIDSSDPVLEAWKIYYRSIFNPARLHQSAMEREMPRYYWKNLPEAAQIRELIANAGPRVDKMLLAEEAPRRLPVRHAMAQQSSRVVSAQPGTLPRLRECRLCPHAQHATQAVAGEGPAKAALMLVGEQPGDQEDLQGRPFVGPAGKVLDRALSRAGLERGEVWLTNAVKHFSYQPRGKQRVHKMPAPQAIQTCRAHLLEELERVDPRVIVCLGRTAGSALTVGTGIDLERGVPHRLPNGRWLLLTVHPAYVLRSESGAQAAFEALAAHLGAARRLGVERVD